ncbi:Carboxylic ester hydrolase [Mycena indigotica]|uniref:Carboxylic ester hydrolase n=1 Tax=Mycena indigotica TaxID=2126181 RepID=A0A8H6TEY0_9AGAR|nr:Carboxylic ester hydrolase [Mycena indigotica]KAF7316009.1 Carboxylic ester hydrolase [Mycena indigotica]
MRSSFALFYLATTTTASPIIRLSYGSFRGSFEGNLSTYLAIPFAAPAVRFTLPSAPKAFPGVKNATSPGPACPQQALTPGPGGDLPKSYNTTSEDCLTLSVFAPRNVTTQAKLPVFVWIYGGGFEIGNSADQDVRPTVERSILRNQPIIVVTPNYRVTAFGFLGGKEVQQAGISNLGLRDQIFALKWVQEHIAAFGGDPRQVVIGGPSAGAVSVALLFLNNRQFSPSQLFRGGFMLSGSPITTFRTSDGQKEYDNLVSESNCTHAHNTLDCLRNVPVDALTTVINRTPDILGYQSLQIVWRPTIDGDVIVEDPLISVAKGNYARLPFITGDADDEGTIFSFGNSNITTNAEFIEYIHSNYLPKATSAQIAQLGELYPEDPSQGSPFDTGNASQLTPEFKRLAAFQGDYFFIGARRFFLQHASRTQQTWSYLSKRGKNTTFLGASHGSDVLLWLPTTNTTDFVLSDALINFINTLNPNCPAASADIPAPGRGQWWPTWTNGAPVLLTLSDPDAVTITTEDFREEPIQYLYNVLFEEGRKSMRDTNRLCIPDILQGCN